MFVDYRPDLVDFTQAMSHDRKESLADAFRVAEENLGVPRIVEPKGNICVNACCL